MPSGDDDWLWHLCSFVIGCMDAEANGTPKYERTLFPRIQTCGTKIVRNLESSLSFRQFRKIVSTRYPFVHPSYIYLPLASPLTLLWSPKRGKAINLTDTLEWSHYQGERGSQSSQRRQQPWGQRRPLSGLYWSSPTSQMPVSSSITSHPIDWELLELCLLCANWWMVVTLSISWFVGMDFCDWRTSRLIVVQRH